MSSELNMVMIVERRERKEKSDLSIFESHAFPTHYGSGYNLPPSDPY